MRQEDLGDDIYGLYLRMITLVNAGWEADLVEARILAQRIKVSGMLDAARRGQVEQVLAQTEPYAHPAFAAVADTTRAATCPFGGEGASRAIRLIRRFPDASFLYFFGEKASHILPLEDVAARKSEKARVRRVFSNADHHTYWDGAELSRVSWEWVDRKLLVARPIIIEI